MLWGLGGYAMSGKDATADYLVSCGWSKRYMSCALEQALLKVNPWIKTETDDSCLFERYEKLHARVGYDESKKNADVRAGLQCLGDVGRDLMDEDVWVDAAFSKVDKDRAAGFDVSCTGIRYPNELRAVKGRKGVLVWVDRPGYGPVNGHSSDNSLCSDDFDFVLLNDGTLEDLYKKIDALVWVCKDWRVVA